MNLIKWFRRFFGKEFVVVKGGYNNAYPCEVGKYMVYKPSETLVWETNLTKGEADALADYLNNKGKK